MQDALGADSTDLNWSAQPSSSDLAPGNGPHSFSCVSLATPESGDRATRIRRTACPVRCLRASRSPAYPHGAIDCQADSAQIVIAEI